MEVAELVAKKHRMFETRHFEMQPQTLKIQSLSYHLTEPLTASGPLAYLQTMKNCGKAVRQMIYFKMSSKY